MFLVLFIRQNAEKIQLPELAIPEIIWCKIVTTRGAAMSLITEKPLEPDPYKLQLADIDMSDPRLYEQGLARRYFQRLRQESPIHYLETLQ